MTIPANIHKYLQTRASTGPWQLSGCAAGGFAGAVIIPALAESARLFATLATLARNSPEVLAQFLVLVVVNQREDASQADRADNQATLRLLAADLPRELPCAWVDATSPGLELPAKVGGVGLARKIGHDLALQRLDYRHHDPLLVSLDADTLVEPTYLPAIVRHFRATTAGGAIIPFRHQQGKTTAEQAAVIRYELFLRSYVLGLSLAGSPYAFHTVGSAMACTVSAYCRMGGMNNRSAGEDFYFLQQLQRTAGIGQVAGTVVHPSARASHRVPFGTGRSIGRLLAGDGTAVLFYRTECFMLLKEWLCLVTKHPQLPGAELQTLATGIAEPLGKYLAAAGFSQTWDRLRTNNRQPAPLMAAFHGWFDGLKTMKLIHHLSATLYPRCEPELSLPALLNWGNISPPAQRDDLLEYLRTIQN
jgi:hypothetical protein